MPKTNPKLAPVGMKWCPDCVLYRPHSDFCRKKNAADGLNGYCRKHAAARTRLWKDRNPETVKAYNSKSEVMARKAAGARARYANNLSASRKYFRDWSHKNADKIALKRKTDEFRAKRRIYDAKRLTNSSARLKVNICRRVRLALGYKKSNSLQAILGYSIDDLKRHLENRFVLGMSWDNYGAAWHIDHIIPMALFDFSRNSEESIRRCFALANLQPLPASENMSKGAKLFLIPQCWQVTQ